MSISPPDALTNKTNGFYLSMASALNLSTDQFQLIQGATPTPDTAQLLYNLFDGVPPATLVQDYTANPVNKASGNYQNVLGGWEEESNFSYKIALANYMNDKNWIGGSVGTNPIYAPTFETLMKQTNRGSTIDFNYTTENQEHSVSNTWAKNSGGAGVGFWGTNHGSSFDEINKKGATTKVTVEVHLGKFATLPIEFGGWWNSGFMTQAYQNPSDWTGGQDAWDKIFGKKGTWQRVSGQVLLVNGYTIKVTSFASYSQSDYQKITTSKDVNVWPFYTKHETSSSTQTYTHNSDSSITTCTSSANGNLQVMGFNVSTIKSLMGG